MTRPPGSDPPAPSPAAAGDFDAWLEAFGRALDRGEPMEVPCGDCNACCRSGQFVHVEADETDTLARIPEDLLFPAPGSPGARVMGYDEAGRCPMLKAGACSIYAHRPRACRVFDCRVFAAAGLDPADEGRPAIADRSRRWRFDYADAASRDRHRAVIRAAARRRGAPDAPPLTATALVALRDVTGQ